MGQLKFISGLLMTSVFAIVLTLFFVNFAIDNNTDISITDNPGYNSLITDVKNNLSTFRTETINASDSFYKSEIQEGETVRTGGQFKVGPGTALATTDNILQQAYKSIFGEGSEFGFVFNTLIAFLGVVLTLYIWKTWKGGLPD